MNTRIKGMMLGGLVLITLTTTVKADSEHNLEGFFVNAGLGTGVSTATIPYYIDYYDHSTGIAYQDLNAHQAISHTMLNLDLAVGYAFLFQHNFSLNISAFSQLQNKLDYKIAAYSYQINPPLPTYYQSQGFTVHPNQLSYGILLSPGYFINPRTRVLIDLGLSQNQIDNQFASSNDIVDGDFHDPLSNSSQKKSLVGYLVGMGFEHLLSTHLSLETRFDYLAFPTYTVERKETGDLSINRTEKYSVSLNNMDFKMGVNYYF